MQLIVLTGIAEIARPFSILGRIGGDATFRDACGCFASSEFQYPRSDRRRCNPGGEVMEKKAPVYFSILGRIGGDATQVDGRAFSFTVVFQYPRSDRRRCNEERSRHRPADQ